MPAAFVPTQRPTPLYTPAGIRLKRLAQASGLQCADRLLVSGILQAEVVAALAATDVSAITLVRPDRPYPNPKDADVVWMLGIDRDDGTDQRLGSALRCLVPGGRLLIELVTAEAVEQAAAIAALLRRRGMETVRVEPLRPGISLVRGRAPAQRRQAA
jgi:hypothetical protein